MKYLMILSFISLVSIGKGQSSKKVSYMPLPKWVDTTNGIIINVNTNFTKDGVCLYDSLGRLIRVESGECSLVEMVYDKGKWVPFSKCSYYKSKHIKEQTKIDTTTPPHGGMAYPDPMQPLPKKDTISASFHDIVFLMQQNMELSQRLDRLQEKNDSLVAVLGMVHRSQTNSYFEIGRVEKRLLELEQRPFIYIDNLQKELWVKCPDGSCDIFIRKL